MKPLLKSKIQHMPARRIGILWAMLALLFTAFGCNDLDIGTQLAEEEMRYSLPSQEFTDVLLTHTEDGEKVFVLHAPRLDRYDRNNRAEFYGGIEIEFFEDGAVSSRLTADHGEVLDNGQVLTAVGNVVVTTDTGTTIKTPRMRWTQKDELITSDTTVMIITDYDTLRGSGLIASDDLSMRRILNPTGVSYRSVESGSGGMLLSAPRPGEEEKAEQYLDSDEEPAPLPEEGTVVGPDRESPMPPDSALIEKGAAPLDSIAANPATVPADTDSVSADTVGGEQ